MHERNGNPGVVPETAELSIVSRTPLLYDAWFITLNGESTVVDHQR